MSKPETSKAVAIWLRVSTEDQVRGESPETHERRARGYAESRGWNVVEVYRLDAVSGKTVKEHPEAKRMLADIRADISAPSYSLNLLALDATLKSYWSLRNTSENIMPI
jgi:Resolvase, N terminal domain